MDGDSGVVAGVARIGRVASAAVRVMDAAAVVEKDGGANANP